MPNRIIHEKACASPTLHALTAEAERLFWRLTTQADDHGRFDADPRVMGAKCFPLGLGSIKPTHVLRWRDELVRAGAICLYRVGDRLYGAFLNWSTYQRQRDSKPKYPAPEDGIPFDPTQTDPNDLEWLSAANRGGLPQPAARARAYRESRDESRESLAERREPLVPPRGEEPSHEPVTGDGSRHEPQTTGLHSAWDRATWGTPEALAHLYNTLAPDNVPAVETLSPKRRERARAVLRVFPAQGWWEDVFAEYGKSKFLSGKTQPTPGHESFRPDFDWLLSNGKNGAENAVKVHDGVYRDTR